jgi:methylenetetrahydrofolate--tRNA-(uracil-5-)-methyltransferase
MECRRRPGLFFAGQITGVEGYAESIASGFAAAVSVAAMAMGQAPFTFPDASMTGSLLRHITTPRPGNCQPMNANFGLLPEPPPGRKRERKARQAYAALSAISEFRRSFFKFNPLCVT